MSDAVASTSSASAAGVKPIAGSSQVVRRGRKTMDNDVQCYTPEEALSLIIECKLSKKSYEILRRSAIQKNAKILYPAYYRVAEAKKNRFRFQLNLLGVNPFIIV